MTDPFIWIRNGAHLPLDCRLASDIPSIEDIAHSLSQLNRWTGWGKYPLSVAQHSVMVSYLVPPTLAKHGLLHDAHETLTGDINTPVKRWIDSAHLRELCYEFDDALAVAMDLRVLSLRERFDVKEADLVAAYTEATLVMGVAVEEVAKWFGEPPFGVGGMFARLPAPPCDMLREMTWREARDAFLRRWNEIENKGESK
jgi:hypothetical protein